MTNKSKQILSGLTRKENIYFTRRGNVSIKTSLRVAKEKGKTKVIIQDQGGWITYNQFPEELKMELVKVKTDYGQAILEELKKVADSSSVILWNSAPGYFCFENNMDKILELTKKNDAMLINDVSGSIGEECAKFGDIIIGSFGRWKPIWIEQGGFIASDYDLIIQEEIFDDQFFNKLSSALDNLDKRKNFLLSISQNVKNELKEFNILKSNQKGYNVIIKYGDEKAKQKIIKYCADNDFEYTQCPRYIRVMEDAISIEIKRKKE